MNIRQLAVHYSAAENRIGLTFSSLAFRDSINPFKVIVQRANELALIRWQQPH